MKLRTSVQSPGSAAILISPQFTAAGVAWASVWAVRTRPVADVAVSEHVPSSPASPVTRPDAKTSSPSAPELTIVTVAVAPGVGDAIGEGVAGVAEDVGVGTATVALVGGTGAVVVEPGEPAEPVSYTHLTLPTIA